MMSIFYGVSLLSGLIFLWWSGEKTITYTQRLSKLYNLDSFFLGFILLAVATGLPELFIMIQSLVSQTPTLAVGDLVGSNFFDIALVLGLPVVTIGVIAVTKKDYARTMLMLGLDVILMSFVFVSSSLTKWHGVSFISIYLTSCWFLWRSQQSKLSIADIARNRNSSLMVLRRKTGLSVLWRLMLSVACVLLASKISVFSSIKLVELTSLTFELVGATIIAIGTSLPELTLSLIAVRRKDYALAVGNSFGSVLEQGGLILGILALFSPAPIPLGEVKWVAPFFYLAAVTVGIEILLRKKIGMIAGIFLLMQCIIALVYAYYGLIFK